MLDGVHHIPGSIDHHSANGREPVGLTQSEINALPSIMGPVTDPDSDSTARVDKAGYVYLWEPDEGIGFWVQAGYVRSGRPRFGQLIDPNDIQWFDLAVFKKKLLRAKESINAVRLPSRDDIWNVTSDTGKRDTQTLYDAGESGRTAGTYHASGDSDADII